MKNSAERYIDGVIDGSIVVGKKIKLAVERHLKDLKRAESDDFPYYFDPKIALRPIRFIESFCRHSKGEWAGTNIALEPWQQFSLWSAFGWLRKDNNLRRFRVVYKKVARKNGKSTETAGLGLYMLSGDREPGAEVYSAATKKDQAKIIHEEATRMVKASPDLRDELTVVKNNISIVETASKFEPLSSDDKTLDGLNIHCGLLDEVHAHPNRGVYDVIETATGSRRQPLIWCITTAGIVSPNSIAMELEQYGEKVLKGIIQDETFLPLIWDIDEEDDWRDEKIWIKANPNLGVSVKLDDLRAKCKKAIETPAAQNNFKCKHLNVWSNSRSRWIPVERWDACKEDFDIREHLGRECFAGLDLSTTTDISALTLVFPMENGIHRVLPFFWVPEENADLRARRDRVPYPLWIKQGLIESTPGNVIDYSFLRKKINDLSKVYRIKEIAFDPWNAVHLVQQLREEDGLNVVEMRQGFASMSSPMKSLESEVMSAKLRHNGNEVLRWMFDNVSVKMDPAGNIKPDKEKSAERIDGIVALIMGLARAVLKIEKVSPYESGGIAFI